MKIYRNIAGVKTELGEALEADYTGAFMGERYVSITYKTSSPIDFNVKDFVEVNLGSLRVDADSYTEIFELTNPPSIKKTARAGSISDAFEYTLKFDALQHELTKVQMRDITSSPDVPYTGDTDFSFYGNATTVAERIKNCLDAFYGANVWTFEVSAQAQATENFQFDCSGITCWEMLTKVNDENGLKQKFFIENRKIYIGFESKVLTINGSIFEFKYGKSSHKELSEGGGLYDITKTVGSESIITRLRAYGGNKNLQRYYNATVNERRYISRLMLPQYSSLGIDYIESERGIQKYGIREGSITFDEVYPTIHDVRLGHFPQNIMTVRIVENSLSANSNPVMAIQCYVRTYASNGQPIDTPTRPASDIIVTIHSYGQVVRVLVKAVAQAGEPTNGIAWCIDKDDVNKKVEQYNSFIISNIQTVAGTKSDASYFYSAYCYRTNNVPDANSSIELNTIIAVEEILETDDSDNYKKPNFWIYVRDFGFDITEQYSNGEYVHVPSGTQISFKDGLLGGYTFRVSGRTDSVQRLLSTDEHFAEGARYKILLLREENETGNVAMPNAILNARTGDHFVILGIYMPDIYVYWAEQKLLDKAKEYLSNNDNEKEQYTVTFDTVKMAKLSEIGVNMREGISLRVVDLDLQISTKDEDTGVVVNHKDIPISNLTIKIESSDRIYGIE